MQRRSEISVSFHFIKDKLGNTVKTRGNTTHESSESAVFQARDNPHSINSVLKLCVTLGFTVREAQLSDQHIEKNHYNHRHVG